MTRYTISLTDGEFSDKLLNAIDNGETTKWFVRARDMRSAFMAERCCCACGRELKTDTGSILELEDVTVELGPKCSKLLTKMGII